MGTKVRDAIAALGEAVEALEAAEEAVFSAVAQAREEGHTWDAIGEPLGITGSGARNKYRDVA